MFLDRLHNEARRAGARGCLVLLFIDLDHFKVNDRWATKGDLLLRQAARRISERGRTRWRAWRR
jgi:GGDEF domain-containing protein